MSFNHAVIWIDHREAHVIHFNAEQSTVDIVKTHVKDGHLDHQRGNLSGGNAAPSQPYLHEVVSNIAEAHEVLVVGPGSAKLELVKHIHSHDPKMSERILGVETVDHPTDPQLLAYAKKYFLKVDKMRGDTF